MATTQQWQAIFLTLMHVKKHYITFNSAKTLKSVGFSVVFDALTNKNVSYTYAKPFFGRSAENLSTAGNMLNAGKHHLYM